MRVSLLASTALLALTTAAVAETVDEGTYGMSEAAITEETQAPPAPAEAGIEATLGTEGPELRTVGPDPLHHRGGTYTDGGEHLAGNLTDYEIMKLDAARAAIEASRIAGTLYSTTFPAEAPAPTEEDLADMKRARLESSAAPELADDPLAGIGTELPAVQEVGPEGLTAAELAKRDAGENRVVEPLERDEDTVGAPPTPIAPPTVEEPRDGNLDADSRGGE